MVYKNLEKSSKLNLKWFIIGFLLIGVLANLTFRIANNTTADKLIMRTDSEGYYQYLPHFFIFDWEQMDQMHWAKPYGEDKKLNVYTCGVAIMQMPFFLAAHAFSYFFELEQTGYEPVYFLFLFFASLIYVLAGLVFLYLFLRRFFNHLASFLSIILIFFATNLFYYTIIAPGMSHAYSFSLIALFVYLVPLFYEKFSLKILGLLSFILALSALIRPTNLIVIFFLLFYETFSLKELKSRIHFWINRWYYLVLMVLIGIIVFIPQMLYWHTITGKYIFYSYQEGGTFPYWLSPKIFTVLIGPRNGWFIYTPLMIFAVSSLIFLTFKKKLSSWVILFILLLIIYINSSWWRPTFSGAAGYRALIEYLPFMSIPLTYFSEKVLSHKSSVLKIGYKSVLVLFVVYNILFSYQYSPWHWWNTDWTWSYFLKLVQF